MHANLVSAIHLIPPEPSFLFLQILKQIQDIKSPYLQMFQYLNLKDINALIIVYTKYTIISILFLSICASGMCIYPEKKSG